MWDLKGGTAEVATVNGKKAITFTGQRTKIAPLMKDMTNYLPEMFTIEMDIIMAPSGQGDSYYELYFYNADKREIMEMEIAKTEELLENIQITLNLSDAEMNIYFSGLR